MPAWLLLADCMAQGSRGLLATIIASLAVSQIFGAQLIEHALREKVVRKWQHGDCCLGKIAAPCPSLCGIRSRAGTVGQAHSWEGTCR